MYFASKRYGMTRIAKYLFRRNRAEGYPGKGLFGRPDPVRKAFVDIEICKGCGDCYSVCYYRKIKVDRRGIARIKRGCSGCRACMNVCPSEAITMINIDRKV